MPQRIQLRDDLPFFDLQVTLESVTYTLEFRWNVRAGKWFMSVLDETSNTVLQAAAKVVANWPLFAYVTGRQPAGAFLAFDTTGAGLDPGLNDLGNRVQLIYFTTAELGL